MVRPPELVKIQWLDAVRDDGERDADSRLTPMLCTIVGFLVEDEEEYVTLSMEIDEHGGKRMQMSIPRSLIRETRRLVDTATVPFQGNNLPL